MVMIKSGFKLKRPHSPDYTGIENYKKQRLLEDFANLNLDSNVSNNVKTNVTLSKCIDLPLSNKTKSIIGNNDYYQNKLVERIRDELINDQLQVLKWQDPKRLVYEKWLEWFKNCYFSGNFSHNVTNYYDETTNWNGDLDMDMDIDMDTDMDMDMDMDMTLH